MFDKLLVGIFQIFWYSSYKRKYKLPKGFRFNGYFIRIRGNGNIIVGKNSYISFFSYINLGDNSTLKMGNNVSIAHNVKIYTNSFVPKNKILRGDSTPYEKDIIIGNNVLIGSNTFITPGVTIGDNVIIGANSVVSKDVPSNCICLGNPAHVVKRYAEEI